MNERSILSELTYTLQQALRHSTMLEAMQMIFDKPPQPKGDLVTMMAGEIAQASILTGKLMTIKSEENPDGQV